MAAKTLLALAALLLLAAGAASAEDVPRLGADDAALLAKWSEAVFTNRKLLSTAPNVSTYLDQAPVPTKEEVLGWFDKWNAALLTKDADNVVDLYAPNSVLLPTLWPVTCHDDACKLAYFTEFLTKKPVGTLGVVFPRTLAPGVAMNSGDYTFALSGPDGARKNQPARFTFVYKAFPDGHGGSKWLIVEHHSSVMPPMPEV